ncbi:MAG: hypothetical protein H7Y13_17895 [Sphingobacteriaceae bacterium]|nr:hypothetical protein [Sphingobacteriaceae bacterium]
MKIYLILLFVVLFAPAFSQDLKGFWQGYITADGFTKKAYYSINILEQNKGFISGKAYISRPDMVPSAYGLVEFIGTVTNGTINFTELKIVKEVVPKSFFLCLKFCRLLIERGESTLLLKGRWTGDSKDCIPGNVFLSKQVDLKSQKDSIPGPVYNDLIADVTIKPQFLKTELSVIKAIPIKNRVIKLEIRDYLKKDNDTVSVYLNRNVLLKKLGLKKRSKTYRISLNPQSHINEILLYAENLGDIPPNTSLLTIIDGKQRHTLLIESSLQKTAVIYLEKRD